MKSALVLVSVVSLASCSAKVSSDGGEPAPQPSPYGLEDSPASQELKVSGITAGSDGSNQVVVSKPNTTARDVSFTVDAKVTGKLELSLDSTMEFACTGGGLEVKKFFEDVTGGSVQSTTDAVGRLPLIAGHSYRVRYRITAAGACDAYQEDFKATFIAGALEPSTPPSPSTPATPDQPSTSHSCATAEDIGTFYGNAASGEWCEHIVTHPETSVSGGRSIATADQLALGTKLAIVAGKMNFAQANALCSSAGAGFALPLSVDSDAAPRAGTEAEASKSVERVGKYLANIRYITLWSGSSADSLDSSRAWMTDLASGGGMFQSGKIEQMFAVCVK